MDLAHYWFQAPAGGGGAVIGNSLRFRGAQSLTRTPTATGNRKTWTWSGWIKRGSLGGDQVLWFGGPNYTQNNTLRFNSANNELKFFRYGSGGWDRTTNANYRDPSAWLHCVLVLDTTQAVDADRGRLYVNGVRITSWSQNDSIPQNADNELNQSGQTHYIGAREPGLPGANVFSGYMAEIHFVDGQALDATDFGEFNADGVWVPKKVSGVTYGTNGFYLDFSDPANIGADRSGNGNNFTPTGFELTSTSSTNYDWTSDSPTNNFSLYNPLHHINDRGGSLLRANYQHDISSDGTLKRNFPKYYQSIGLPPSGKWYFECLANSTGIGTFLSTTGWLERLSLGGTNPDFENQADAMTCYCNSGGGNFRYNSTSKDLGKAMSAGNWMGIAIDMDNQTYRHWDGAFSSTGSFAGYPTDQDSYFSGVVTGSTSSGSFTINSGTLPLQFTPPAGFKSLSTANLPDVAITKPSDHFQTILDTGANILSAAQTAFPNGLWWIKDRANSNQHQLVDSVRGGNLALRLPGNSSVNTQQEFPYAAPSGNSVAWGWSTDAAGLNATAGFQIIQYVGDGSNSGRSIPHSLGVAPEFVIIKDRGTNGTSQRWWTWHKSLGDGNTLNLDANASVIGGTTNGSIQTTTSANIVLRSGSSNLNNLNAGTNNFVVYAWASIPGYSSFGTYKGNGNKNGVFIHTGMRPAFVLAKATTGSGNDWRIWDSSRNAYNLTNLSLAPSVAGPEDNSPDNYAIDILSNGFKLRSLTTGTNGSGTTYIYMAFAEHCFGGSNVSPAPAR